MSATKVAPTSGALAAFDNDGSGFISPDELAYAAKLFVEAKESNKKMKKALIAVSLTMVIYCVISFAVMVGATFYVIKATTTMEAKVGALADINGNVLRSASGGLTVATKASSGTSARRLSGVIHGLGDSHVRMLSAAHDVHPFHFAPSASALRKHAQGLAGVPDAALRRRRRRLAAARRAQEDGDAPPPEEVVPADENGDGLSSLEQPDGSDVIVEELTSVSGFEAVRTINGFCQMVSEGQDPIQLTMNFAPDGSYNDTVPLTLTVSLADPETVMSGCDTAHKTSAYGFSFDYISVKFNFLFGDGGVGQSPLPYMLACTSGLVPNENGTLTTGFCSFSQVMLVDQPTDFAASPESGELAAETPADDAQAEQYAIYINDCGYEIQCPTYMSAEMCTVADNSCLGPSSPEPGSPEAQEAENNFDENIATRRRVRRAQEDINAAAGVLEAAGIQTAGARALAHKFPEAILYKTSHVSKSSAARKLVAAHNEAKRARALGFAGTTMESAAAELDAYNTARSDAHMDCTGPINDEGHRACTLKDVCWSDPKTCLYGPIAPWGSNGGFGSDRLPFLSCSDYAGSCGESSVPANFNLGAGLPTTWAAGVYPTTTAFSQAAAGAGTEKWIGPGAKWGSYLTCQPLINDLVSYINGRVNLGQNVNSDGSATLPSSDPASKLWTGDDYAPAIKIKMNAVYNCWCEKTPTCFSGLDKATPQWFQDNVASLAALKGGDVIARAYSLGVQIARPPAPDSREIVDFFYASMARIVDATPQVSKDSQTLAAVLNGETAPTPTFTWASAEDRTQRLKQILEASYNPNSVYAGKAAAGINTKPFKDTPYGIGSVTWQHMVPCCESQTTYVPIGPSEVEELYQIAADETIDEEIRHEAVTRIVGCDANGVPTSEFIWAPTSKGVPLAFTIHWASPFSDFSYSSYESFSFQDWTREAPAIMTCTSAEQVLKNWLWSHVYEQLKALHPLDVVPEGIVEDESSSNLKWVDRFAALSSHPENPFDDAAECLSFTMFTESNDGAYVPQCVPSNSDYTASDSSAQIGRDLVKAFSATRAFYTNGHANSNY